MDRWLGDGGMTLIAELGAAFTAYGAGWSEAQWAPTPACCNPGGTVQAGVHSVLLDAVMNFALVASLKPGEHVATLEMKVSTMRPTRAGDRLTVRGGWSASGGGWPTRRPSPGPARRPSPTPPAPSFSGARSRSRSLEFHRLWGHKHHVRGGVSGTKTVRPARCGATSWPARSRGWCRWRGRSRRRYGRSRGRSPGWRPRSPGSG